MDRKMNARYVANLINLEELMKTKFPQAGKKTFVFKCNFLVFNDKL